MARRNHNVLLSTGAQPSTICEEPSIQSCTSQEIRPSSNDLSREEQDEKATPSEEGVTSGTFHKIRKFIFNTVWAIFQGVKPERILARKIDALKSPKLKSLRSMNKFMSSLSSPLERVQKFFKVGESWQKIQGCDGWKNLLNPLDPVLRAEMYRYGEFAKATYDAFDSKYCDCKYTEEKLLEEVGMGNRGYKICQFLYATAPLGLPKFLSRLLGVNCGPSWMGFVAVCTSRNEIDRIGRRDIVVAWRGTMTLLEWIKNIQFWLTPFAFGLHNANEGVKVETGFLSIYNSSNKESLKDKRSARDQVLQTVKELVEKYKGENLSITVTGHSLGSALATLCAYDISQREWISHSVPSKIGSLGEAFPIDRIPITVFSFAGPRVGNREFKNGIESDPGVAVLRVVNEQDIITKVPLYGIFQRYTHVGVEFEINNITSENPEETGRQTLSLLTVDPMLFFMTMGFKYVSKQHSIQLYLDCTGRGLLWTLLLGQRASYFVTMFCVKLRSNVVKKFFSRQNKIRKSRHSA